MPLARGVAGGGDVMQAGIGDMVAVVLDALRSLAVLAVLSRGSGGVAPCTAPRRWARRRAGRLLVMTA